MASMDRQKLVEDKKQELLRRIAEKKRTEQNKQSTASHPSPGNSQTASTGGAMFLNDGNFLARFQAMQQQQNTQTAASVDSSAVGSCGDVSDSRPFVSMKLTTVKKTTPAKPVASRPDIFEAAEDVEENGKFAVNLSLSSPQKLNLNYLELSRELSRREHLRCFCGI